jgi:hypothetical protein
VPRRLAALAAAGFAALGLAACGAGGSEDEYKDEFPQISREIVSLGREVGDSIENAAESSDRELAGEFSGFAEQLGDLHQELDELEPPDDLADEQDALSSAIGEVHGSLEDIADAAEESDPDAARRATIDLVERSEELREARRALALAVREL